MNTTNQGKKKLNKKILLTAVITAVISVFISFLIFSLVFLGDGRFIKLKTMEFFVNNYFYGEIDGNALTDRLMLGYVEGLGDKYAAYYDEAATDERQNSLQGVGMGIGVIVTMHPETENIYVKNVYDDSPAASSGIKVGDQIVSVDGALVSETGYASAVESIVREIGEKVRLGVLRDGKSFEVEMTCEEFAMQTVFSDMLDQSCGYIEITAFNGETATQFENAVNRLLSEGAVSLIFDVRNNGGGTVDSVCEIVDFLCPEGDIMTVRYKDGTSKVIARSDKEAIDVPMAVLTNGSTASAAELFTASVKDFGKGISVGEKTYGKGVMQSTYNFIDGSSVVFTVAEFLSYSGVSFNEKGIEPDIEVAQSYEERLLSSYEEDAVIIAAMDYLNENN